jgi:hypothetical protein
MKTATRRGMDELIAALETIRQSPADDGRLEMIVRRPAVDQREVLNEGDLDPAHGLVGDNWHVKPSSRTPDRSPHADMQLNVMNARVIDLVAGTRERWALAGDQLYVDLDLSPENLPPGTRLRIGGAVIEVTAQPHTGCTKFVERFGPDALKFVNSADGRRLNLRGINARVIVPGRVRIGDRVTKENGWRSSRDSEPSS